ncbi:MAG: hypothetical protein KBS52_06210, partial [Clostridiales bacterium]|nr:hypothetical protein [Candidatus Equinaster intestinalis]
MVKTFKQMSKKVLATVLAVVMIASCMSVSFSVLAASTPFAVTAQSPAVPLYKDYKIDVNNITVGGSVVAAASWGASSNSSIAAIEDGYLVGKAVGNASFTVNGQKVWVLVRQKGASENKADFNLIDLDFSNSSAFVASDWIEGSYTYIELPDSLNNTQYRGGAGFSNKESTQWASETYNLTEAGYLTGKYEKTSGIVSYDSAKQALKIPAATEYGETKAIIYKSQMMNDFYDYTVETGISETGSENMGAAPGLLARVDANYNATAGQPILTTNKTTSFKFRNYGGVTLLGINTEDFVEVGGSYRTIPILRGASYSHFSEGTISDYFMCTDKSKVLYPDGNVRNITMELNGINFKYTMGESLILDTTDLPVSSSRIMLGGAATADMNPSGTNVSVLTSSNYASQYNNTLNATRATAGKNDSHGTVGFTNGYANDMYIHTLKVTAKNILDQSLPEMEQVETPGPTPGPTPSSADDYEDLPSGKYPVTPDSPAVPLYVDQSVTVSQLEVKIGGTWVNGADLNWEKISGPAARYNEEGAKLEGRSKGNTLFEVTDESGNKQNVWVIVNEKGNDNFSIVNYDFNNGASIFEWKPAKAIYKMEQAELYTYGGYTINKDVQCRVLNSGIVVKDGGEELTKKGLVLKPIANAKNATNAIFLTREELKDFADYTVEAEMGMAASLSATPDKTEGVIDSVGMFARTTLNDLMYTDNPASLTPALSDTERSLHIRFRNYGGIMMSAYANEQTSEDNTAMNPEDENATYFTATEGSQQTVAASLWKGGDPTKTWTEAKYDPQKDATGEDAIQLRRVNLTLDGNGVAYSVDGNPIYDTINTENKVYSLSVGDDIKVDNIYNNGEYSSTVPPATEFTGYSASAEAEEVQKGTIGFSAGYGTDAIIFSVKVTPKNIKDYPSSNLQYANESYPVEYKVSSNAPIIPMWKGYRLVLDNLYIEMSKKNTDGTFTYSTYATIDGKYVPATSTNLTWTKITSDESDPAVAEKVEVEVDSVMKQRINANNVGRMGYTVTSDDGFSQNVWIVVSEKVEGKDLDYTLVDFDFTDENDANVFNPNDWICGSVDDCVNDIGYQGWYEKQSDPNITGADFHHGYQNGGFTYIDQAGVLGYSQVAVNGEMVRALKLASEQGDSGKKVTRIAVLDSDILKDFKDYKISAEVANVMTTETENTVSAVGFMARTVLNPNLTTAADSLVLHPEKKSTMFRMRNYGGLGIYAYRGDNQINCEENTNGAKNERMWVAGNFEGTTYWTFAEPADAKAYLAKGAANAGWTMTPDPLGSEDDGVTVKTLSLDFNEYDINYALNGHEIFNTQNALNNNIYRGGYWHYNEVDADTPYDGLPFTSTGTALPVATYRNNMRDDSIGSIKYDNGTIGFSVNYGEDLYVLKYKVEAMNTNEVDVPQEEMPVVHEDIHAIVRLNTRVSLNDIDAGLTLPDTKNATYEIKANTLLAFAETAEPIVLQAEGSRGYEYSIDLTIVAPEYAVQDGDNLIVGDRFANDEMRITPLMGTSNSANDYKVTVNLKDDEYGAKKEIVPGTLVLKHDAKAEAKKIVAGNNDGESYNFTVIDPLSFIISAQYTSYDHNMTNIAIMGSTVRVPSPENYNGGEAIRFLTRIPALKADAGYYNEAYIWWPDHEAKQFDDSNGYVAFGSFALPTKLLEASGEKGFKPPANFNPKIDEDFVMGGYKVRNIPITSLAQATEKYSDAWCALQFKEYDNRHDINVLDTQISIVSYIYYKDKAGNFGYIMSNGEFDSYYGIYEKANPITNAKQALTESVITPYRYENFADNTTTFAVDINGAYALDWHIEDSKGQVIDTAGYAGTTDFAVGRFAVTLPSIAGMKFCATIKGQNIADHNRANADGVVLYHSGNPSMFEIDANGDYHEPIGEPTEPTEPEEPIVSESGSLENLKYK